MRATRDRRRLAGRALTLAVLCCLTLLGAPGLVRPALAEVYPVTTLVGAPAGWAPGDVTVSLSVERSGVSGAVWTWMGVDGAPPQEYAGPVTITREGITPVVFWSTWSDWSTHEPQHTEEVRIDRGMPSTALSGLPGGWVPPGAYSFSLAGADALSGVAATYYRVDNGPAVRYAGGEVPAVAPRGTTVTYWSVDGAGNTEPLRTAAILVDDGGPFTSVAGVPDGWTTAAPTLALSARSAHGAIEQTIYRVGERADGLYAGPFVVSDEGTTVVRFGSRDSGGNAESSRTVTVRVDRSAPVSAVSGVPAAATPGPVTVAVSASDAHSGVAHTWCRIDGGEQFETRRVRFSEPGLHTLEYRSADVAGNQEAWHSVSFSIAPAAESVTTTHTITPGTPTGWDGWYNTTPTVSVIRNLPGVTWFGEGPHREWQTSSEPVFVPLLSEGERPYSYFGVDSQGATESVIHFFVLKLDTRPPQTGNDAVASYVGSATIHLLPSDPSLGSGVQGTFWDLDGMPGSGALVRTSLLGQHTLEYESVDAAGNFEAVKRLTFTVVAGDGPPPAPVTSHSVMPVTPNGSSGWYVTTPTVMVFRDATGTTYFGEGAHPTWQTSTLSVFAPVLSQGDRVYSYFGVGSSGATETPAHLFGLKLDGRAPAVTDDAVASYAGVATVHLSATDPAPGSGVAGFEWTLDGHAGSGSLVTTAAPGEHALAYRARDVAGNVSAYGTATFTVVAGPSAESTRVPGADRWEVSARLAERSFPGYAGVRHVIVACGSDRAMADPLSAAGLAGAYRAPLLLVQTDTRVVVPAATIAALQSMRDVNGPLAIHIVGGPASVTAGHVRVLARFGSVDRVGGADRYSVAAGVAARMRSVLGSQAATTALVANGNLAAYHWNALAASPVAAAAHYPILLVKNGSVPPVTAAALRGYAARVVVGDAGAVNAAAYAGARGTERLGGADRAAVAASVAERFCDSGELSWGTVGVAARLSDSLAGGASLGAWGGPLLLTESGSVPAATSAALSAHAAQIGRLTILGGTSSVTPAVETQLRAALGL